MQAVFSCAGLICWHGKEPLLLFFPFVATHFFPDNAIHSYGLQVTGNKVLKVSCQSPCQRKHPHAHSVIIPLESAKAVTAAKTKNTLAKLDVLLSCGPDDMQ